MKFKEIKPGMVIHCPTEENAKVLSEYLIKLGVANANHIMEYYGLNNGTGKTDTVWIKQKEGYLSVEYSDRKWYEKDKYRMEITEFSDLIEPDDSNDRPYGNWIQKIDARGQFVGYKCKCGCITQTHSRFCPECGKDMYDDSPINSDTDSPMSAVEVLEWFEKNYWDQYVMAEVFGSNMNITVIVKKFGAQGTIDKITAYEAAKKAPKPAEVERGWNCTIYGCDGLVATFELWGCTKEEAEKTAQEETIKCVSDNHGRLTATLDFICRVKESES